MVFPALGRFWGRLMKLTEKSIAQITLPKGKSEHVERDDDLPAFGYRLRAGGSRTFIYQYKTGGRQNRKITLGNATALSAARARKAAVDMHAQIRLGGGPCWREAGKSLACCRDNGPRPAKLSGLSARASEAAQLR